MGAVGPFLEGVILPDPPSPMCRWTGPMRPETLRSELFWITTSTGLCNCDYGQNCTGQAPYDDPKSGWSCPKEAPKCWGAGDHKHCCEMDVVKQGMQGEGECDADFGAGIPSHCGIGEPPCDSPCCGVWGDTVSNSTFCKSADTPFCVGLGLGQWPGAPTGKGRCYPNPHPVPPTLTSALGNALSLDNIAEVKATDFV